MKTFLRSFPRLLCFAAVGLFLAIPTTLPAETSRRHPKHQPADDNDDDDASPTPSPTPAGKAQHRKADAGEKPATAAAPASSASSATKNTNSDELTDKKSDAAKPISADEVAPSKAPEASTTNSAKNAAGPAAVSSIDPAQIEGFDTYPEPVHKLLSAALDLTKQNLTYSFGSNDPKNGGMDCSGTIYYLLNQAGFINVPRQASEQYDWVRSKSRFYAVLSKKQDNFELKEMRPGDLLFWTGTYRVDRDPPVTHTMIYLGKRKSDGQRIMFGASDGRPYNGERRNGVSVFDFKMPAARSGDAADAATAAAPAAAPDFSGYGPIPGMTELADAALRQPTAAKGTTSDTAPANGNDDDASPTPKPSKSRSGKHHAQE